MVETIEKDLSLNKVLESLPKNDLWRMTETDALIDAFYKSKRECHWKASVQRFEYNLLENILALQKELREGTYVQSPFREFDIKERGKLRHIKAIPIRDRVVQRALCDYVLIPKLKKYWIHDNGASVKGKGISFARKRIRVHLMRHYRKHGNEGYILQIDFHNFFGSIPQEKVLELIYEKIDDKSAYELVKYLLSTFSDDGIGLGIGSQLSQICGIYYPTIIDNFCKIVLSISLYGRYMDDIYIIHPDKDYLQVTLVYLTEMARQLGLEINKDKTHITKLSHGFTFMKHKYNLTDSGKIIERMVRSTVTRERRKLKKYERLLIEGKMTLKDIENAYRSWKGNNKNLNSYNTIVNMDKLYRSLFKKYYKATDKINIY